MVTKSLQILSYNNENDDFIRLVKGILFIISMQK